MPILSEARPTQRYGPPPYIGIAAEGDGHTITCRCKWLRWLPSRKEALDARNEHDKKCKAIAGEVAA